MPKWDVHATRAYLAPSHLHVRGLSDTQFIDNFPTFQLSHNDSNAKCTRNIYYCGRRLKTVDFYNCHKHYKCEVETNPHIGIKSALQNID